MPYTLSSNALGEVPDGAALGTISTEQTILICAPVEIH